MSQTDFSPATGFPQFALSPLVRRGIADAGFTEPRPIQAQTIPAALAGSDVMGLAQTGTGKTAAFALPIIEKLHGTRRPGPRALVLAPTRELATQIHADFERLAKHTRLKAVTVYGGVAERPQVRALQSQPDVVIACPGRLLDLFRQGKAMLAQIKTLVLDEADLMFDMGFLPDIQSILSALPGNRQNLLFAATMPKEVRSLADRILDKPHVVELANKRPVSTIEHALYRVSSDQKIDLLKHLLSADDFTSAIVFLRTKHRAKRLGLQLEKMGHNAVALQGNMTQGQRDRAMAGFREGRFDVLVATDIASRGIDVAGISHVINFDVPNTPDAYTHRIGRTGRAEMSGKAFTLASREEAGAVKAIERNIGAPITRLDVPELGRNGASRSAALAESSRRESPRNESQRNQSPRKDSRRPAPRKRTAASGAPQGEGKAVRRRRRPRQG